MSEEEHKPPHTEGNTTVLISLIMQRVNAKLTDFDIANQTIPPEVAEKVRTGELHYLADLQQIYEVANSVLFAPANGLFVDLDKALAGHPHHDRILELFNGKEFRENVFAPKRNLYYQKHKRMSGLPLKSIFLDFAKEKNLPAEDLELLEKKIDEAMPRAETFMKMGDKCIATSLVEQWKAGTFAYLDPIIEDDANRAIFKDYFVANLTRSIGFNPEHPLTSASVDTLLDTLLFHDKRLRDAMGRGKGGKVRQPIMPYEEIVFDDIYNHERRLVESRAEAGLKDKYIMGDKPKIVILESSIQNKCRKALTSIADTSWSLLYEDLQRGSTLGFMNEDSLEKISKIFHSTEFDDFLQGSMLLYLTHAAKGHEHEVPFVKIYQEYGASHGLTPDELSTITERMERIEQKLQRFSLLCGKTILRESASPEHLLDQWKEGKFTYSDPVFTDPHDLDLFIEIIGKNIRLHTSKKLSNDVVDFTALTLKQRLLQHEAELVRHAEETAQHREIADKLKEEKRREKEARRAAMEASPSRPAPRTTGSESASSQIVLVTLNEQATSGTNTAQPATLTLLPIQHAQNMLGELETGHALAPLDDLLLCSGNMLGVAKAFRTDALLNNIRSQINPFPHDGRRQLQALYSAGCEASTKMDEILADPFAIILLATPTLDDERAKDTRTRDYATILADRWRKIGLEDKAIETIEKKLEGFTATEREELLKAGDKDSLALQKAKEDKQKIEDEIESKRAELAKQILEVLGGKKAKHETRAPLTLPVEEAKPPAEWQEWLGPGYIIKPHANGTNGNGTEGNGISHHSANGLVRAVKRFDIYYVPKDTSSPLSVLHFIVPRDADEKTIRDGMSWLAANVAMAKHLVSEYGFSLGLDKSGQLLLTHPEYDIEAPVSGSGKALSDQLVSISDQFRSQRFMQRSLLRTAAALGVDVQGIDEEGRSTGKVTVTSPNLSHTIAAERGYLSTADFAALSTLVAGIQSAQALPDAPLLGEPLKSAPAEPPTFAWEHDEKETLLIFDANVIDKLTTPRGIKNNTWLDIVKCTARLPHLKVVIPAYVADFEMQGKVAEYDEKGNFAGLKSVNPSFEGIVTGNNSEQKVDYLTKRSKAFASFIKSATRARIDRYGNVHIVKPGQNKNIIILENDSKEDQELRALLHDIAKERSPEIRDTRVMQEIQDKDLGEKAIERIIRDMERNRIAVISDDFRWMNTMPRKSRFDHPVTFETTASYLDAEIGNREGTLRRILGEKDPLSLDRIDRGIREELAAKLPEGIAVRRNPRFLVPYEEPASAARHSKARDMYSIIHNAIGTARYDLKKAREANGTHSNGPGKWTAGNPPATPPEQRGIAPDSVHERPGDGAQIGAP